MQDPRHEQLAEVLVNYSCKIQPGENVLIQAYDIPIELVEAVVMQVAKAGGNPLVDLKKERLLRALLENATEESLTIMKDVEL